MSIALSAVVKPSSLLFGLVGGMCSAILLIAALVGSGQVGELPVYPRLMVTGVCIFAALFSLYRTIHGRKTFHIDISGGGQIRLREDNASGTLSRGTGEVVCLMADSTIWPHLLLLRLEAEGGRITVLPILPDCVTTDSFRGLSVACRWIAAHNNRTEV